jgi:UDP-N-acetylglucosamine--N-acetylmuramyl-(pentapeptide) pyrophosphoryl-undecaprenol N-acetylglucosamine transferase
VSVPPCLAAGLLKIPVFTHECDFSPGLATKLNSRVAKKVLLSYPETAGYFGQSFKGRLEVTGNPVRPIFYNTDKEKGREFLNLQEGKPVLLVLGGSSGARQINNLVLENLAYLTEHFQVIHQTGGEKAHFDESAIPQNISGTYKHYGFIYSEMPDVLACADLVLSRSGANSLWECAVLGKAMVLVPLCGSGTRGDQVENARFFVDSGVALSLVGDEADSQHLQQALNKMLDADFRRKCSENALQLGAKNRPAKTIAEIVFAEIFSEGAT